MRLFKLHCNQSLPLAHYKVLLKHLTLTELVVRAETAQRAREIADRHERLSSSFREWRELPATAWLDPTSTVCEELSEEGVEEIVCA